jgi:hypothetical protein
MRGARRRSRTTISALASLVVVPLVLTGCITTNTVEVSGSGTVTLTWQGLAEEFNGTDGDSFQFCPADLTDCRPTDAERLLTFYPAEGSTGAVLQVGTPVVLPDGTPTTLPAGRYTLQARYIIDPSTSQVKSQAFQITIGPTAARPVWQQSFARASADETCPRNWAPSWAQWPQDGAGGYVCDRTMFADAPDEQVPDGPRAAQGASWLQSVPRDSEDSECPDGWTPSWAQWPQDGAGGFTCDRLG